MSSNFELTPNTKYKVLEIVKNIEVYEVAEVMKLCERFLKGGAGEICAFHRNLPRKQQNL